MKFLSLLTLLTFFFAAPAFACEEPPCVTAVKAYAYATTSVQKNGAVFMQIKNNGDQDNKILSAASDVAKVIELHTHIMDGDVMMMREVEAYDLPAGAPVLLEPMGHHIMLMGLKAPLKAGDHFPLTLTLENDETLSVDVQVKALGSTDE